MELLEFGFEENGRSFIQKDLGFDLLNEQWR